MECSSLVSVVPISTGRSREVSCVSKVLIERSLGSLFSHLGLWSRAETRGIGGSASTSLLSIVLGSCKGDWGTRLQENPQLILQFVIMIQLTSRRILRD